VKGILASEESGETEVGNLEVELGVEQEIFWLKISVGNALVVAVFESFDEDSEVGSGDFFRESARVSDVLEKLTTWNEFHDNGDGFVCLDWQTCK
jgi:hypothetical protein